MSNWKKQNWWTTRTKLLLWPVRPVCLVFPEKPWLRVLPKHSIKNDQSTHTMNINIRPFKDRACYTRLKGALYLIIAVLHVALYCCTLKSLQGIRIVLYIQVVWPTHKGFRPNRLSHPTSFWVEFSCLVCNNGIRAKLVLVALRVEAWREPG